MIESMDEIDRKVVQIAIGGAYKDFMSHLESAVIKKFNKNKPQGTRMANIYEKDEFSVCNLIDLPPRPKTHLSSPLIYS